MEEEDGQFEQSQESVTRTLHDDQRNTLMTLQYTPTTLHNVPLTQTLCSPHPQQIRRTYD